MLPLPPCVWFACGAPLRWLECGLANSASWTPLTCLRAAQISTFSGRAARSSCSPKKWLRSSRKPAQRRPRHEKATRLRRRSSRFARLARQHPEAIVVVVQVVLVARAGEGRPSDVDAASLLGRLPRGQQDVSVGTRAAGQSTRAMTPARIGWGHAPRDRSAKHVAQAEPAESLESAGIPGHREPDASDGRSSDSDGSDRDGEASGIDASDSDAVEDRPIDVHGVSEGCLDVLAARAAEGSVAPAAPAAAAPVAPAARGGGIRLPGLTVRGTEIYFADGGLAGRFLAWGGAMDCSSIAVECRVHQKTQGRICQRSLSRGLGCPRRCGGRGCLRPSCCEERVGGGGAATQPRPTALQ